MRSVLVLACLGGTAYAEEFVERPVVLAPGQVEADLTAEINIGPNAIAYPVSLAPDVWWGATSQLTVGIVHSGPSVDRIEAGATVCVRTDDVICTHHYRGSGVDVRYGLGWFAPRARLLLRDVDPAKPAVTLGALMQWHHGRVLVSGDPYLQLGLANTDKGNRAELFLPVWIDIEPVRRWALELRTGYNTDLAVWTDGWHVPVYAGVKARATEQIDVGAALGFTSLLGPQNTAKERVVFVIVGWRW